jgi:hypothetical protein
LLRGGFRECYHDVLAGLVNIRKLRDAERRVVIDEVSQESQPGYCRIVAADVVFHFLGFVCTIVSVAELRAKLPVREKKIGLADRRQPATLGNERGVLGKGGGPLFAVPIQEIPLKWLCSEIWFEL